VKRGRGEQKSRVNGVVGVDGEGGGGRRGRRRAKGEGEAG
jgi:hypothetical protein